MDSGGGLSQTFISKSIDDIEEVAALLIEKAGAFSIWLFEGEMGAGKTTLIKAICKNWGVEDTVSSPTFSIINEYLNSKQEVFYHFDFYRIKDEYEAMDIGCDEYFYSGHHCFIEWPSKIPNLIPDQHVTIAISTQTDNSRRIDLTINDK